MSVVIFSADVLPAQPIDINHSSTVITKREELVVQPPQIIRKETNVGEEIEFCIIISEPNFIKKDNKYPEGIAQIFYDLQDWIMMDDGVIAKKYVIQLMPNKEGLYKFDIPIYGADGKTIISNKHIMLEVFPKRHIIRAP